MYRFARVALMLAVAGCGVERERGAAEAPDASTVSTGDEGSAGQSGEPGGEAAADDEAQAGLGGLDLFGEGGAGGASCDDLGYEGSCDDDVLTWCEGGEAFAYDCADDGDLCAWASPELGYDCVRQGGFGYPVGDGATAPAGGWTVTQVLGHYLDATDFEGDFEGGHLAEDVALSEDETAHAPVFSIGDGEVLYAGPNASSYVNVVLVRHEVPAVGAVCSFYGHLGSVHVVAGQRVARGDTIASVLDWNAHFGWPNSHLHYVVLSEELCLASHAAGGALICGYDESRGDNGIETLDDEPPTYTSVGDPCGDHAYPEAFLSPSRFIDAHHF
jgi:murein DD-endopeptidase MepM/ murein hydrolase activator NlpD